MYWSSGWCVKMRGQSWLRWRAWDTRLARTAFGGVPVPRLSHPRAAGPAGRSRRSPGALVLLRPPGAPRFGPSAFLAGLLLLLGGNFLLRDRVGPCSEAVRTNRCPLGQFSRSTSLPVEGRRQGVAAVQAPHPLVQRRVDRPSPLRAPLRRAAPLRRPAPSAGKVGARPGWPGWAAPRHRRPVARPRPSASGRDIDEPAGKPRRPRHRSAPIAFQVSASNPATGPECWVGQALTRRAYSCAQERMPWTVSGARDTQGRA